MLVDLHVKTKKSEGVHGDIASVIKTAKAANLDAIAIVETLSTADHKKVSEAAKKAGIICFVGLEIPTDKGVLLIFPAKVDASFTKEKWRELTDFATPSAEKVIEYFGAKGAAIVASKPYDKNVAYKMGDGVFNLEGIHAIEVFNSRVTPIQADFALEAATTLAKPTVGGSDPALSVDVVGKSATLFSKKFKSQAAFVEAIINGECWAVSSSIPTPTRKPRSDSRSGDRGGRGGDRGGRGGDRGGRGGDRGGRGGDRGGRGGDRGGRSGGGDKRSGGNRNNRR